MKTERMHCNPCGKSRLGELKTAKKEHPENWMQHPAIFRCAICGGGTIFQAQKATDGKISFLAVKLPERIKKALAKAQFRQ